LNEYQFKSRATLQGHDHGVIHDDADDDDDDDDQRKGGMGMFSLYIFGPEKGSPMATNVVLVLVLVVGVLVVIKFSKY